MHRAQPDGDPARDRKRTADLLQGQVGLLGNQLQHLRTVLAQPGATIAAHRAWPRLAFGAPALLPANGAADADIKPCRCPPRAAAQRHETKGPSRDWGCDGGRVFPRSFSDRGWIRGLGFEAGGNRGGRRGVVRGRRGDGLVANFGVGHTMGCAAPSFTLCWLLEVRNRLTATGSARIPSRRLRNQSPSATTAWL